MKLAVEKVENHSRGIQSTYEYQVLNNAKIMEMLSSTLYTDKIKSPIRELVANAHDSSLAARTNAPYIISLPTRDNPEFRIRDYGISLSENQLIDLYRYYGLSDKDESNEYIGAYGIGSKSPWAYTNVYTTTSYYQGMQYIYVNTKSGKNGRPELRKISESSTTEPDGVEISFAVKQQDITSFAQKTAEILIHFPDNFKVINNETVFKSYYDSFNLKPLYYKDDWKIYNAGPPIAIMGYVAYPIDRYQFTHNALNYLLESNINLYFDIGDLEVNLGREELQYTDKTKQAIINKLTKVDNEIKDILTKEIEESECYYDACVKYKQSSYNLQRLLNNIQYKGIALTTYFYIDSIYSCQQYYQQYGRLKKYRQSTLRYDTNTKFVINDISQGSQSIIEDMISKDNKLSVVSVKIIEKDEKIKKEKVSEFCKHISIPESRLIYLSDIKKNLPKTAKALSTVKKEILSFKFESNNKYYGKQSYWTSFKVDLKAGGYYIPATGYDILLEDRKIDPHNLSYIIKHLTDCQVSIPTIVGLRPTHVKKIKDDSKWILITDWIQERFDILAKSYKKDDLILYQSIKNLVRSNSISIIERLAKNKNFECEDLKQISTIIDCDKYKYFINLNNTLQNSPILKFKNTIEIKDIPVLEKYSIIFERSNFYNLSDKEEEQLIKVLNCLNKG